MTKRGNRFRASVAARVKAVREYRFGWSTLLVGGLVLLVAGVGIGASTPLWNDGLRALGFKPNVPPLDLSSVENTYEQLAANYDGKLDASKLIDGANHGLVAAVGDPYTVYFNSQEAQGFDKQLNGQYSGIGAVLGMKDSVVEITGVLDGSPAKSAGLQNGDLILQVDGQSTQGWSIDKAATNIQGKAGTTVKLVIQRGDETKEFSIVRADITNPSVRSEVQNGVGILSISRFDDQTGQLARQAAESLKQQGVKGVIVDLRGNPGGRVDAAQAVAGIWLNDKVVVTERTKGITTGTLRSGSDPILEGVPTIVLVDGGSASASEILAGALHDNHAATLYGQKTFGKGIMQDILDLPDGNELKVTIASWYTPDGKNIGHQGITPDTVITPTPDQLQAGQDPAKDAALSKLGG